MNNDFKTALASKAEADLQNGIKIKFEEDKNRTNTFSFQATEDVFIDFSKTHIDADLLECYLDYANDIGLVEKRHAFLSGEHINNSEDRAVLHALLRDADNQGIEMKNASVLELAQQAKQDFDQQCKALAESMEKRTIPVRDIIHVGIGGSSLGTQLLFEALSGNHPKQKIHFVANIDAHQLANVLSQCSVDSTLVIGVSKTFTTAETLQNLNTIEQWFIEAGVASPKDVFIGVTSAPERAQQYGIPEENVVGFPTWVGGRYSVWSSVSLSAALVLGKDKFDEFLKGAARIDQHFYQTKLDKNVCFLAAALDHYYVNFLGSGSKAIFAYDFRLRSLVDYLQQLETESNGKDRNVNGEPVEYKTSPVVWGGVGTDVQHSVFQMLHQGTSLIPAEFILVKQPDHKYTEHHDVLLANGIAQTAALLEGQSLEDIERLHGDEGLTEATKKAKIFAGNRPSSTVLVERLTPAALGSLLAFYEHRTFFGGVLTDINSFDQMGVELGKRLAKEVQPYLQKTAKLREANFDPSTEALIARVLDC
ncbi:MAG: glucose-6-phosphate isomerase [Gammaproteobacteria bacterium]|nr:glucose-6-phosphate isomerase [Gammaproteobacteria bacterium]